VREERRLALALRWLINASRERKEKNAEGVEEAVDIIAFFFRPSHN